MRMTLVLVYLTSITILQIFYVAGVSVSGISPSAIYSSISSNSVPTYNGNLQEKTMSSTLQPFEISEGTLTSLNRNLINNLDTEISSNSGLGQKAIKILERQVGQKGDNNDGSMLEKTITKIQPSEMSTGSSISSTTIPNFEIPVHINNGPGPSNIHHETSKTFDTSRLNEVNQLDGSSGEFKFGEFDRLSGSISENDLNLVDIPGGLNKNSVGKVDSYRRSQSRRNNLLSGSGGSTEFNVGYEIGKGATEGLGKDKGFSGSIGSIRFGRKNRGRKGGSAGKEGRNRRFSRSNGSIRFGRKNKSRTGGSGREERGDIGISRSNRSIRFGRKNKSGTGGLGGKKGEGRRFSGSVGSTRFSRKNKSGTFGLGGEEGGDTDISRSNGSIRFSRKKKGREEESRGLSESDGSIRFGREKKGREGGSGGEEEESRRLSGSDGSIRFGRKNQSGTGGSGGEEEEESRGFSFSGSAGSIRFGGENKSESGGSGEENIKISEENRPHETSSFRGDGEMNGGGKFGGSVDGLQFGEKSGDKELSKSSSININRTGGNYGVDGYIEDNGFVTEFGTGEESDEAAFGEFSGSENYDS